VVHNDIHLRVFIGFSDNKFVQLYIV